MELMGLDIVMGLETLVQQEFELAQENENDLLDDYGIEDIDADNIDVLIVGAGVTVYGYYYGFGTTEFVPTVSTVTLTRGDVVDTVGATGALEAVTTVQVGSQVSGIIEALYVDYNSIVRQGDVIARLEPSLFETQIEQGQANLTRSEADLERLQVTLDDAEAQLARSEDLSSRDLISTTELEAAQVATRSAAAQLKSAEAGVIQSRASLNQNEVSLGHTVITAPIEAVNESSPNSS